MMHTYMCVISTCERNSTNNAYSLTHHKHSSPYETLDAQQVQIFRMKKKDNSFQEIKKGEPEEQKKRENQPIKINENENNCTKMPLLLL